MLDLVAPVLFRELFKKKLLLALLFVCLCLFLNFSFFKEADYQQ